MLPPRVGNHQAQACYILPWKFSAGSNRELNPCKDNCIEHKNIKKTSPAFTLFHAILPAGISDWCWGVHPNWKLNFVFTLTQPDCNLRFLFLPCGFLSLPCSVGSLDFMSYTNQSVASVLIHHLGSSRWMKLDGCAPHCTPQPPAVWRKRVLGRARPARERWEGITWQKREAKGMSISRHHLGSGSPLSMQLFVKAQQSSSSPIWGCGASESSVSVNKLSGTSLIHHGYWVTAKDPTVIRLSFFSDKWVYSDE